MSRFHDPVGGWFRSALGEPTRAQALGWAPILDGKSALILAPTGSGKTLAAFLAAIERVMWSHEPAKRERCHVLYISPLKALAVDVEKNLRAPIAGIAQAAERMGVRVRIPTIDLRTGDTPAKDRARMARTPPDILITTPESLYLMLTSQARETLASVDVVIIDEIHQLVPSKRGAHLFLSLERLEELRVRKTPMQRIGLSATQRPLDEVARFLGGLQDGVARPVAVVDAGERKAFDLLVEAPDAGMGLARIESEETKSGHSVWPHIHARVVQLIRRHKSTMVFVNSRRLAERFASALNDLAGEEIALAHHGSVAREKRAAIEERLKRGDLPAIVATSSLELGIDMGAVDLVIQIEAPASVASGLQRIGRACHQVGGVPRGVLFPKHRADILACATATPRMRKGLVEETFYPRNPLDVLAQQIVAIAASSEHPVSVDALYALVRRAAPYADLPRSAFDGVLDMLSGRYPSEAFAELRPRVTWDRVAGTLRAREGARQIAVTNGGTIPDRGLYGVFLAGGGGGPPQEGRPPSGSPSRKPGGRRVGELDEEMVFELREGEVFLLGASSWRAEEITLDRVLVSPAAGEPGKMPFWHGDRLGRSRAFGQAIGALTRMLADKTPLEAAKTLTKSHDLDANAARALAAYVAAQVAATGEVPSDRTIVVERTPDEIGDLRVCVLTPFGTRVHAPWSIAIRARLERDFPGDIDVHYTDDGMVFRIGASDVPPPLDAFFPSSDEVDAVVTRALAGTSLFAARFRECAARALLLPRRGPQKRTPLWAQRKRAHDLLAVASQHPSFPIVLETYRECLRDVFDLPGLVDILRDVEARRIRVVDTSARVSSPFASSVLFAYVANFIYDADAPLAERRAQALTIDHAQLRELLGEADLRQLLDPEAIAEHERMLQRLLYPAKHADAVHDMLVALGELSLPEIAARATPGDAARGWIAELVRDRRAIAVRIGGEARFAAAEDAGRLRDGLGTAIPAGLPAVFLEPTGDALTSLVARYARTRGPFLASELAARFGLAAPRLEPVIDALLRAGKIVEGELLAQRRSSSRELCDAEVLRTLRRKSLARLRREVEPVEPAVFARFLAAWQGVAQKNEPRGRGDSRRDPEALLAAIAQLAGAPLIASTLESEILPARAPGYRPWDLDQLCASGEVVWAGIEASGTHDGRIALYPAAHEPLLARPIVRAEGAVAARIRELLERRGAVFFAEIARVVGGFPGEVLAALWELVWSGEVTNDTLEPLRSLQTQSLVTDARKRRRAAHRRASLLDTRAPRGGPSGSEGRWSLRGARWHVVSPTEKRAALARSLLDRYGIVTREVAHAEGIAGGFSAVYDVLKAMEDSGRARRGYFIAGRGGAQFALPGADERLRGLRHERDEGGDGTRVLAATDPANAYGAALEWPAHTSAAIGAEDGETTTGRPQRAAGALVVLHRGVLLGWLGRTEQALLTFLPEDAPARAAAARVLADALARLAISPRRRALLITHVDGEDAAKSALARYFVDAGFARGVRGLMKTLPPLL